MCMSPREQPLISFFFFLYSGEFQASNDCAELVNHIWSANQKESFEMDTVFLRNKCFLILM